MLMALVFVLAFVVTMSDTSFGQMLRQSFSRFRLARPTRGQSMIALLLIVFTTALVAFLKTDGLALAARTLPDGIAWFATVDLAAYLDIVAFAALAAIALRLRVVLSFVRNVGARFVGRLRSIRHGRSSRAPRSRRNGFRRTDDDPDRWARSVWAT